MISAKQLRRDMYGNPRKVRERSRTFKGGELVNPEGWLAFKVRIEGKVRITYYEPEEEEIDNEPRKAV